jgi:hypothetical protein
VAATPCRAAIEGDQAEREKRKQETLAAGEADIAAARQEWEDALA